ncbi:hypothetical protein ACE6H2_023652 [Prunus campanulata]
MCWGLGCEKRIAPSSKPHGGAKKMPFGIHDAAFDDLPLGSSEWKNLQGEVSIVHIGRDWYKVEFTSEADVLFILENRLSFVQGQIFTLQCWTPDFSPFHAVDISIVGWVRIPFLPLHYKDPEVLYDLVSNLGDPIGAYLQSAESKQGMFVKARLMLGLTRPLKRCLVLGESPQETRIFVSYEALFAICFYCSQKMERGHACCVKISNKRFLQVERLEIELNVFPRDLVLKVEEQQKLVDDVILVSPQLITVDSFAEESSDPEEKLPTEVQDPRWTVVANRKGKAKVQERDGRTFKEVAKRIKIGEGGGSHEVGAKFFAAGHNSKGKERVVVIAPVQSQEGSNAFTGYADKSPEKRARDEEEVEEESIPSVEIRGEYLKETDPSVSNTFSPNP